MSSPLFLSLPTSLVISNPAYTHTIARAFFLNYHSHLASSWLKMLLRV